MARLWSRDGDPAKPDAGPVIKSGFYGGDKAAESHKFTDVILSGLKCWRYSTQTFTYLGMRLYTSPGGIANIRRTLTS